MVLTSAVYSEIEDHIRRHLAEQRVPGASVAIIQDDQPLLLSGFGFADIENQIPVTENTTFPIASLTKQFTATLVTVLALEGKLHLDDAITKWLPEGGHKWSMISVRHLIAHLSGISDAPMNDLDDQTDYTEDEFVSTIASAPLLWQSGTKWDYCNSGYVLLGALIHRITSQTWYDAMSEKSSSPLE